MHATALGKLTKNLVCSGNDKLKETIKEFGLNTSEAQTASQTKLNFLSRKGVYPYYYMDCIQTFDETKLPEKKEFYTKLNVSVSDEDYEHAQNIWREFGINNIKIS